MEQCPLCNQNGVTFKTIAHRPCCPVIQPEKQTLYSEGWDDGRVGKPEASVDPTYQLGYTNGVCAAEESENGFKAWGY